MSYKDLINQELNKTSLKPKSIKLYNTKLNMLYDKLGKDNNNNHLNNKRFIMNYINKANSVDDKLAYLNAIIKIIPDGNIKKYYQDERNKFNKIKMERYKNNIQSEGFVDYQILLNASPKPDFTQDIQTVLNEMLLYISVRYPMRLTLWNITVVYNKKYIKPNINYLYITSTKMQFIMQAFKNIDSLGIVEIDIDSDDKDVIKNYLKYFNSYLSKQEFKERSLNGSQRELFLYNYYRKIISFSSENVYARKLKNLLEKKTNKDITMNDIRRAYETELIQSDRYRQMTNEEKEKAHLRLLHTAETARAIYNKIMPVELKKKGKSHDSVCDCCDLC